MTTFGEPIPPSETVEWQWPKPFGLKQALAMLDVPTAVWPRRKPGEAVRAIRRRALTASLILWTVLSGGVIALAGPGGITAAADWAFRSLTGVITLPGAVAVSVAGGGVVIFLGIMIQIFLVDLFSVVLADKNTPQDVMNELISYSNDPLWSGLPREPSAPDQLPDAMQFANDLAKGFGLPPAEPIPLEPERRDFRAPQDPEATQ